MPEDLTLRLPPSTAPPELEDREHLLRLAAHKLGVETDALEAARATRISLDARRRGRGWVVRVRAWMRGERPPPEPSTTPPTFARPAAGAPRVAIVGSGPAGLFCALDLLAAGLNVTVLERGRDVRTRRKAIQRIYRHQPIDPDSNMCFGEGGAGTYSDGKLYTRSGSKEEVAGALRVLVAHGAPPAILVSWRPHIGSNRLPGVVSSLRETILRSGGEIRFAQRAEELVTRGGGDRPRISAVIARDLEKDERCEHACAAVVLATGHSALDALLMAARAGARLEPKGFAMGLRIEHPQDWLDRRQYGDLRARYELPASFYELTTQVEGRGVYSFCMCPGGLVVPSSSAPERVVVNGMSLSRRDSPYANGGLVVAIEPEDWCGERGAAWGWPALLESARRLGAEGLPARLPAQPAEDPLFGIRLQLALESLAAEAGGGGNRAPVQRADHFRRGGGRESTPLPSSYRPGLTGCDLVRLLPRGMSERLREALGTFDRRLPGFASEIGHLIGVESRTSSPVRIVRDRESLESPELGGLFPCGEGAGYAGGIVSSALDGRRVACSIARRLTPGGELGG